MSKKKKVIYISILIGLFVVMMLMLLSAVLDVGEKLNKVHPYVEIGFYVLAALLIIILIIRPIIIILAQPTFSIDSLFDEEEHAKKNYHMYRRVTKNIIRFEYIEEEDKTVLLEAIKDPVLLKQELGRVFDETIKKEMNKIIVRNAETVMISTAISQNGKLDMFTVLAINFKLIKALVLECGFRPNFPSLIKLMVNVLGTALIAEGLEGLSFGELFPNTGTNFLAEIPLVKPVMSSVANGMANALLCLRVGIITRNYLFIDVKGQDKNTIRRLAFAEAVVLFPSVLAQSVKIFPDRIGKLFKTKKTT